MKRIAPALLVVALVVVPAAHAKFRIRMALSDATPTVGQPST